VNCSAQLSRAQLLRLKRAQSDASTPFGGLQQRFNWQKPKVLISSIQIYADSSQSFQSAASESAPAGNRIVGIRAGRGWQRAGDGVGGRAPRQPAGSPPGGMAHLAWRRLTATVGRPHAGIANGGRLLPALAQAARATCRLARGAATQWGFFLANNFRGGLFCHFIGAGGLMCQKFVQIESMITRKKSKIYFYV
jgi:hypothetical protein